MSDKDINQMDFKELRSEVQLLRDELAIMRREYEDLFYNLDTENFSSNVKNKLESVITEDNIQSVVKQEADKITLEVDKKIQLSETTLYQEISTVSVKADEINMIVNQYDDAISNIQQTSTAIELQVKDVIGGSESIFQQTADGFLLDGRKVTITGILYFTDDAGGNDFWIVHDQSQDPNFKQVMLSTAINDNGKHTPIVIGDIDNDNEINVYIGGFADGNQPATRQWVLEQLGK